MALYQINNLLATTPALQAMAAAYKSVVGLNAANGTQLRRFKISDVAVGTASAPNTTDQAMEFDIARMTAAGTATASLPVPLDSADQATSLTVGNINYTAEPTVTANSSAWYLSFNQRATYRWSFAQGSELVAPATNLAGFVVRGRAQSGYTGNAGVTVYFIEQ
jgi:hypothetical protein